MDYRTLLAHQYYFNEVFTPRHFVALGGELAEQSTGKDTVLVEFMRKCVNDAVRTVEQHTQRGYSLELSVPENEFRASLEAMTAPHTGHSLNLSVKQSPHRSRNSDMSNPGYIATLELRLRENPLPIPITAKQDRLSRQDYEIPDLFKEYTRLFLGLNTELDETTVTSIPILEDPAKDFYSDNDAAKTCSPALKARMISFLNKMRPSNIYSGLQQLRRKDTDTGSSSRRQLKV